MEEVSTAWKAAELLTHREVRAADDALGCLPHGLQGRVVQQNLLNGLEDLRGRWIQRRQSLSVIDGVKCTPHGLVEPFNHLEVGVQIIQQSSDACFNGILRAASDPSTAGEPPAHLRKCGDA